MLFLWMLKLSSSVLINKMLKYALLAVVLSAILTTFRISLQAGQLYDEGFSGLFNAEMIGLIVEGPLGTSSYVRLAGLGLLLAAILFSAIRVPLTIAGGILVAVSFALIGHATKDQFILGTLITIHLLAVSYWFGGFYPLHRLAKQGHDPEATGKLAHSFGKQAAIIVPILIGVGAIFAIYVTGSPIKLITSDYGQILIIKIVIVAILLALAALNKLRFVPRLLSASEEAALHLRLSIKLELVAFLLIFAATAILTSAVNLPEM
ncbi:MAG: CopD family protein [Lentilitoribacter sp.]